MAKQVRITLKVNPIYKTRSNGRHSARNELSVTIEPVEPVSIQYLWNVGARFANFLSLCLGSSVRLRTVLLHTTHEQTAWMIRSQRESSEKPDRQKWLRVEPMNLARAVATWFTLPPDFIPFENLVYGTIRKSSMFVETEFLSLAQALECFHRLTDSSTPSDELTFKGVLDALLTQIDQLCNDASLAIRLKDSIRHSNQLSFRDRNRALIARLPTEHAQKLLGDLEEFEQTLRQTRNFLTHPGTKRQSKVMMSSKELFLFNQKLHAFLRLLVLMQVGFPEDVVFEPVYYQSQKWR